MKISISKNTIKGPFLTEEYISKVLIEYAKKNKIPKMLIIDKNKAAISELDDKIKKIDRDTNVSLKETKDILTKVSELKRNNIQKYKTVKNYFA